LAIGGARDGVNRPHDGYIEELRITKGEARYTANFNPPVTAFTADANCKLLLHFDGGEGSVLFGDSSGSAAKTVTANGAANTETTDATPKFGTASLQLDGSTSYLSLADSADWDLIQTGTDFTIDLWVKHTDHVGNEYYIMQDEGGSDWWAFYHSHGGGIKFEAATGGAHIVQVAAGGEITDTDWHHVAVTKSGTTYTTYKDGTVINSVVDASTDTFSAGLFIGTEAGATVFFDGYIDELRISRVDRTADPNDQMYLDGGATFDVPTEAYTDDGATVLLLHMDGADDGTTFTDSSGHTVTPAGNAIQVIGHGADAAGNVKTEDTEFVFGTTSAYFDGTGDYIELSDSNDYAFGDGDFTIDFWIYVSSWDGSFDTGVFIIRDSSSGDAAHFSIKLGPSANKKLKPSCYTGSALAFTITTTTAIADTTWTHVALVCSGGTVTVYLDGTADATTDTRDYTIPDFSTGPRIGGGSLYSSDADFNGYIDELRISKYARWTANFTPPTNSYTGPGESAPVYLYAQSGDGTVTTDGDYKIHTFTADDTFTVATVGDYRIMSNQVEYLVVAGGGGGGSAGVSSTGCGGGGGGEVLSNGATDYGVSTQAYTINVGVGGLASATNPGGDGGLSEFGTINSDGGGGGGGSSSRIGRSGGSGGGGGSDAVSQVAGGSSQAGGNDGGASTPAAYAPNYGSGGGGGAGAVGAAATTITGGNGGAGVASVITGASVNYAGGGGGGTYDGGTPGTGSNGGGNGGDGTTTATSASVANPGSGGGGSGSKPGTGQVGGDGADGVVIIRYKFQ
jgi:hypothetical protein